MSSEAYLGMVRDTCLSSWEFLRLIHFSLSTLITHAPHTPIHLDTYIYLHLSTFTYIYTYSYTAIQVDRLEDELVGEQEKLKGITEELEQTFAEMSGY